MFQVKILLKTINSKVLMETDDKNTFQLHKHLKRRAIKRLLLKNLLRG